ncbi:MAG TPA: GNAT family acetyltransferase, partial [Candidatus Omnitrophota bacterium]|nr:GNAT family acetyltransferase [Candidatus Omnitrophota bacterium]
MNDITVRKFSPGDRQAVRDIAWDTAFMGETASVFFDDKEILCDFLTEYFTDFEPDPFFVAESGGRVVGYLAGSL